MSAMDEALMHRRHAVIRGASCRADIYLAATLWYRSSGPGTVQLRASGSGYPVFHGVCSLSRLEQLAEPVEAKVEHRGPGSLDCRGYSGTNGRQPHACLVFESLGEIYAARSALRDQEWLGKGTKKMLK